MNKSILLLSAGIIIGGGLAYFLCRSSRIKSVKDIVLEYRVGEEKEAVRELYRTGLGREPELGGLEFWSGILEGNQDIVRTSIDLISGGENELRSILDVNLIGIRGH